MSLQERRFVQPISYRYDVFVPEDASPEKSSYPLICLHGYGQSKADALTFGRNIGANLPIAALQAPHPHHQTEKGRIVGAGFSWVSSFEPQEDIENHHGFIRHVVDELFEEGITEQRKAFLFGFSQSVSLNYRFAAAHPEYVAGIIAVAGATPSSWLEPNNETKLTMPVLHIAPDQDPAYPQEKAQVFRRQLQKRAADLTWHDFPGGHRVPSASYEVMREWLEQVTEFPPLTRGD